MLNSICRKKTLLKQEVMEKKYKASEVAKILGVYKRTLFNWEEEGKIPKAKRDPMNNYRYYTKEDIEKLKKITGRG